MARKGTHKGKALRKGKRNKNKTGRTPVARAANKASFLETLAEGYQADLAALLCGLGHSTVYGWKKDDPAFAEEWAHAERLARDKMERAVYEGGITGNVAAAQFWLKHRYKQVYGDPPPGGERPTNGDVTNNFYNVTPEEHERRLIARGLVPAEPKLIETDYEVVEDAAGSAARGVETDYDDSTH